MSMIGKIPETTTGKTTDNIAGKILRYGSVLFCFLAIACKPIEKTELFKPGMTEVQPLNSKQMSGLQGALRNIGRIHSAALEAHGIEDEATVGDQVMQDLKKALLDAQCSISFRKASATEDPKESHLIVNGASCPLDLRSLTEFQDGAKGRYSFLSTFSIKDPNLQDRNDIFDLALNGYGVVTRSEAKNEERLEIAISGTARSKTRGAIEISTLHSTRTWRKNGLLNSDGERRIRVFFPTTSEESGYEASLISTISIVDGEDRTLYQLNGRQISKLEFFGYLSHFGLIAEGM